MAHNYTPSNVYHATVTMPDDGDDGSAAAQNVPDECAADNGAYFKARLGAWFLRWQTPVADANWYDDTDLTQQTDTTATTYPAYNAEVSGGGQLILMPISAGVQVVTNDVVEVEVQLLAKMAADGTGQWIQLVYSRDSGSTVVAIKGARTIPMSTYASGYQPISLFGRFVVATSSAALWIAVQHKCAAGGAHAYLYSPMACKMRCWASTA